MWNNCPIFDKLSLKLEWLIKNILINKLNMDIRADTPALMNKQTQMRFFYDLALECNNHCVKDYEQKALDNAERACVTTCYKK